MQKWIYHFNDIKTDGSMELQDILGGKGSSLAEISRLAIRIPPGFTISSDICKYYYNNNYTLPKNFTAELEIALQELENASGKLFGAATNPLLLAVRSGAADSMPGMMDTILNLGLNEQIVDTLTKNSGNKKFALDSYRRFLQMYASIVLNIPSYLFADILENHTLNVASNKYSDFSVDALENIVGKFKKIIKDSTAGSGIPADPKLQLISAIESVLKSWTSERAIAYRKINNINDDLGTAVNIQSMVFGNLSQTSATGVIFTRNPVSGDKQVFGEYLINAQGEDVVSGTRTPLSINDSMSDQMPEIYDELMGICTLLETHYKDAQDIEFTVEDNKLYILQTRSAKRTIQAAIKIAVDMVNESLISKEEAIMRVNPSNLNHLLHSNVDYSHGLNSIASGLPASPGAASGIIAFSSHEAEEMSVHRNVILVRNDTSPEDIKGMYISDGILTARGGMTSHAAVVARGMGKPCVCSVSKIYIDEENKQLIIGDKIVKSGDEITIDGTSGKVFLGRVPLIQPNFSNEFNIILTWADQVSRLKVRANAENKTDSSSALKFGARGIGLCRSEHMFFDKEKIPLVQEMIIAANDKQRARAIEALLPMQTEDFKELFRIIQDKPINIRLLDPPLHEFLPKTKQEQENLASRLNINPDALKQRLEILHEVNPMLGHRGCRIGISYPEIYKMQIVAIGEAARQIFREDNIKINLEIMIPFISNIDELKIIKAYIKEILGSEVAYSLGTMIELPRAALIASKIAAEVDYFSFGTNDLTQTTYGISRDDIGSFLPCYLEKKIFSHDPFVNLDEEGVGELIKLASREGKRVNPKLKLGVCGEHAGDPKSIDFFHDIDIDYISCSPYRIPIARLAAAQSRIRTMQR
jgi:pyruvate, orthophosphate dikinase